MFQGASISVMLQQQACPVEHLVSHIPAWLQNKISSNKDILYHNFYPYEDRMEDLYFWYLLFVESSEISTLRIHGSRHTTMV